MVDGTVVDAVVSVEAAVVAGGDVTSELREEETGGRGGVDGSGLEVNLSGTASLDKSSMTDSAKPSATALRKRARRFSRFFFSKFHLCSSNSSISSSISSLISNRRIRRTHSSEPEVAVALASLFSVSLLSSMTEEFAGLEVDTNERSRDEDDDESRRRG